MEQRRAGRGILYSNNNCNVCIEHRKLYCIGEKGDNEIKHLSVAHNCGVIQPDSLIQEPNL